jgi:hypothetical protein
MVLDANKPLYHKEILTRELESVGMRLNRSPPNIYFKKRKTGGVSINSTLPLTNMDEKLIQRVLQVGWRVAAVVRGRRGLEGVGRDMCRGAGAGAGVVVGRQRQRQQLQPCLRIAALELSQPAALPGPQHPPTHPPQEYKIHNCELLFKEDSTVDDLIDVIEGNRRWALGLLRVAAVGGWGGEASVAAA